MIIFCCLVSSEEELRGFSASSYRECFLLSLLSLFLFLSIFECFFNGTRGDASSCRYFCLVIVLFLLLELFAAVLSDVRGYLPTSALFHYDRPLLLLR